MKKLYLIRHAKSSWKDSSLEDLERPLNKRGKRDAPFMGRLLFNKGVKVDLIISSPAKRAFKSAKKFAKELNYLKKDIVLDNNLYFKGSDKILDSIKKVPNSINTLLIFSHNPDLNELAFNLLGFRQNIPTSGVLEIECNIDSWEEIDSKSCKLISFEYPKNYFND